MEITTKGNGFGKRIVGLCGIAAVALALGLGAAGASERPAYQPGDAAGHAAADLQAVNERQAGAVIRAYVAAVNAHDLEGILALYADDAIHVALPTPDGSAGVCVGKAQFRLFYEKSIADRDRIEVVDGTLGVAGERVAFVVRISSAPWTALGLGPLEANVEAVLVHGRITTHVVILTPASVRELLAAQGTVPGADHAGDEVRQPYEATYAFYYPSAPAA